MPPPHSLESQLSTAALVPWTFSDCCGSCIPNNKDSLIKIIESGKEVFGIDRPGVTADNTVCGLKNLSVPLSSFAA
jgi:hypothetical protein